MLAHPVRLIVAMVGVTLLAACGSTGASPDTAELTQDATPTATPSPTPSPTPTVTPIPTPAPSPSATPEPTPTAAPAPPDAPSAIEILEASFAAMGAVQSMHVEMVAEIKIGSGGIETKLPAKLVVDFQAPDSVHTRLSFFSIEVETIAIGDNVYTTDPFTGVWRMDSEASFAFRAPADLAAGTEPALVDPVLLGIGELDGGEVYRLRGVSPPNVFGSDGALTDAEFWIGVDDFLVRRITAEGDVRLEELAGALGNVGISGPASMSLTITISDFGKPVVIEAPALP